MYVGVFVYLRSHNTCRIFCFCYDNANYEVKGVKRMYGH